MSGIRVPDRQEEPGTDDEQPQSRSGRGNPVVRFFKILGPGVVTGAADDDPSGIATYSQAGATYGNGLLWTVPVTLPMDDGCPGNL